MKEDGVTWPQILNTGKVAMEAYGIAGIPEIILFAPGWQNSCTWSPW